LKQSQISIIYLYKRKYPSIESKLDRLPSRYRCTILPVTASRAFAFATSKVPALFVFDKKGELRCSHVGLESILDYLDLIYEKE